LIHLIGVFVATSSVGSAPSGLSIVYIKCVVIRVVLLSAYLNANV